MRSRIRFPVLAWEFSLKGRIPAVTMVWVGYYNLGLRALLALHPPISPLTSSGQRNRASWASHIQKSVTLLPCPGGRTTKSIRTYGELGGGNPLYLCCPCPGLATKVQYSNLHCHRRYTTLAAVATLCDTLSGRTVTVGNESTRRKTWPNVCHVSVTVAVTQQVARQSNIILSPIITILKKGKCNGKYVPLPACSGPEGSRNLKF